MPRIRTIRRSLTSFHREEDHPKESKQGGGADTTSTTTTTAKPEKDPFSEALARHLGGSRSSSISSTLEQDTTSMKTPTATTQSTSSSSSPEPGILFPSISLSGLDEWRRERLDEHPLLMSSSHANEDEDTTISQSSSSSSSSQLLHDLYHPDLHLTSAPSDWTGYEPSTPVWEEIKALIGVTGRPLSTAEYMRIALQHAQHGYYTRAQSKNTGEDDFEDDHNEWDLPKTDNNNSSSTIDPNHIIGGDFVTAPEVSQVFGECLGVWFATQHQHLQQQQQASSSSSSSTTSPPKAPLDWQWLECGPGTGKLLLDLLRFTRDLSLAKDSQLPFGRHCRRVHLIETSPVLRQQQQEQLVQTFPHDFRFVFHGRNDDTENKNNENDNNEQNDDVDDDSVVPTSSKDNLHYKKKRRLDVHWHHSLQDFRQWQHQQNQKMPLATFAIAQEFIDALPVYAFQKTDDGVWRERLVDVALQEEETNLPQSPPPPVSSPCPIDTSKDDKTTNFTTTNNNITNNNITSKLKKPRLRIVLAPEVTPALRTLLGTDAEGHLYLSDGQVDTAPAGSIVEVCPDGIVAVQDLASIVAQHGGAALVIDYGSDQGSRDSLRGYSRHEQVHFLSRPGLVDITADVDFGALRHAVQQQQQQQQQLVRMQQQHSSSRPPPASSSSSSETTATTTTDATIPASPWTAHAYGPVTQGNFLTQMGIRERIVHWMEQPQTSDEEAERLYQALVRLVAPEEMGERYKVMAITTAMTNSSGYGVAGSPLPPPPGFDTIAAQ